MQFLVLLGGENHFDHWDGADDALRQRMIDDYDAFAEAVRASGTLIAGDALHRPSEARRLSAGTDRVVTDGPYAETKEQLGGFYLVELPDLPTAVRIAALLPREHTVEVRPTLGVQV